MSSSQDTLYLMNSCMLNRKTQPIMQATFSLVSHQQMSIVHQHSYMTSLWTPFQLNQTPFYFPEHIRQQCHMGVHAVVTETWMQRNILFYQITCVLKQMLQTTYVVNKDKYLAYSIIFSTNVTFRFILVWHNRFFTPVKPCFCVWNDIICTSEPLTTKAGWFYDTTCYKMGVQTTAEWNLTYLSSNA